MTEIEAKALANELRTAITPRGKITRPFFFIVRDAADYIEATEARHAAEMRELKEQFSEAVKAMFDGFNDAYCPETFMRILLGPFIIANPDPLVEAWQMAFPGNHIEDARDECAKISAAIEKRGGKIVWEAGE